MEGENKDIWSELLDQFCYLGNMIRGKLATSCDKSKEEREAQKGSIVMWDKRLNDVTKMHPNLLYLIKRAGSLVRKYI